MHVKKQYYIIKGFLTIKIIQQVRFCNFTIIDQNKKKKKLVVQKKPKIAVFRTIIILRLL